MDAFACAVAIQQALTRANSDLPESDRMLLRIGINVGDVMVKDGDIFGDGVNIAARVEALASPGGICVTRGVRDHLRDRVDTKFSDLGEHIVKNIARPVRVFQAIFDPNGEPALPEPPISQEGEPADRPRPSSEASPDNAVEIAFWQSVQATDDDAEYAIYLEQYPEGTFANSPARAWRGSTIEEPGVELAFWETVRESEDPTMIKAYLDKYPKGEFRPLAEILLQRLLGEHGPASEQNR